MLKQVYSLKIFTILILIIGMTLFASLRPIGFDRDSSGYQVAVQQIIDGGGGLEPGFVFIIKLINLFYSEPTSVMLIVVALLSIPLKLTAIYKISDRSLIAVLAYSAFYYPMHDLTQIRVGIASVFFIAAIDNLVRKEYSNYCFKIAIACLFHYSSIILFLLVVVRDEQKTIKIYFLLFIFSVLFSFNSVLLLGVLMHINEYMPGFISGKIDRYFELMVFLDMHTKIEIFDAFHILMLMFSTLLYLNKDKLIRSSKDVVLYKIFLLSNTSYFMFSFFPVVAIRISEYLGLVGVFVIAYSVRRVRPYFVSYALVFVYLIMLSSTFWFIKDDFFKYELL